MIGRIAWFAALAAAALLITGLQVDKQAESTPSLARIVPAPLRNYAQVQVARSAIATGDPATALAEAERLVRRRPVPAEHLTLLATAQARAGRLDEAATTIQVAGQRGWRDPLAQEAVLRLAHAAGDKAEAARRYAALFLRDRTPDALLEELGPAVFGGSEPIGRETLVAIVVGGERWHSLFLRRGAQVMPPADFGAIAAASLRRGADFDCEALGKSIALLRQRDAAAADGLSRAVAGRCEGLAPAASLQL